MAGKNDWLPCHPKDEFLNWNSWQRNGNWICSTSPGRPLGYQFAEWDFLGSECPTGTEIWRGPPSSLRSDYRTLGASRQNKWAWCGPSANAACSYPRRKSCTRCLTNNKGYFCATWVNKETVLANVSFADLFHWHVIDSRHLLMGAFFLYLMSLKFINNIL